MAKEQLKTSKGAIVTEINGVKYFKLQSKYAGDYTKNCGLLGNEIDENFFFLRSNDIADMTLDEDKNLILTRVDGDELVVNIAEELGKYAFKFDKNNGKLIITFPDGTQQVLGGFLVEGQDIKVATDATIDGDGTVLNPLSISEVEKTGTYSPAQYFLDLTVKNSSYYYKMVKKSEGEWVYYYKQLDAPIPEEELPEGVTLVELPMLPETVTVKSPDYVKVTTTPSMPDGTSLGKGFRIVTKEEVDNFGLLYMFSDVQAINAKLKAKGSPWRIPTREDWAELLDSAEYCDEDRTHDTDCINIWTGKHAGARAKSTNLWTKSYREEDGYPVGGEDNLPSTGSMGTFKVYPVGLAEGSRGPLSRDGRKDGKNYDIEGFHRLASYWSTTEVPISRNVDGCYNVYTRTFVCDTRKVLQESSKPSSRLAIRLVKDFDTDNMEISEYENILGYNMPTVLISNPDTKYSKVWTSVNVGFKEFSGVTSDEWSAATGSDKNVKEVYFINEWNGEDWVKKQMNLGDSVVILDYDNDPATSGDTYHEWRVQGRKDGSVELIDTLEALKDEFKDELCAITESITVVCAMTVELSAVTEILSAETAVLEEEVDALSAVTEELSAATEELSASTIELSAKTFDTIQNLADVVGVDGDVDSGYQVDFNDFAWKACDLEEALAADHKHVTASTIEEGMEMYPASTATKNYLIICVDGVDSAFKKGGEYTYINGAETVVDAVKKLDKGVAADIEDIKKGSKDLEKKVEELSAATEELSATTVEIEENLNNLSAATEELSAATVEIKEDLAELSGKTEELSAATVEIKEDLAELSGKTEELSAATVEIKEDLATLSASTEELSAATEEIENGLNELSASTEELSAATVEIENNLNELSASTEELSAKTFDTIQNVADLVGLEGNADEGYTLNFNSASEWISCDLDLAEAMPHADVSAPTLEECLAKVPASSTSKNYLVACVQPVTGENKRYGFTKSSSSILSAETVVEAIKNIDEQLAKDERDLSATTLHLQNEIDEVSASTIELSAATEEIEANLAELSATTEELSAATVEIENNLATLSASTEELSAATIVVKEDLAELSGKTEELSAATEEIKSDLAVLSASTEELSAATVEIENNLTELSATTEELSAATVVIKEDLATLSGKTEELSAATVVIENNLAELSGKTEELSAATVVIKEDLATLSASTEELSAATVEIESNLNELSASTLELSGKVDDVQNELDATQKGAGLNEDGSYTDNGETYLSGGTSIHEALDNLATMAENKDIAVKPYAFSAATTNYIETNDGTQIPFTFDFNFGER